MNTSNSVKQAAPQDWHPADVVAALRKAGWSLRKLSIHHGLSQGTLKNTFQAPYPNGERLIAEALNIKPHEIWPSRYDSEGKPNRGRRPGYLFRQSNEFNGPLQRQS